MIAIALEVSNEIKLMFVKHRAFQMSFIQMAINKHRMLFINDQADKKHGNNLIQTQTYCY